MHFRIPEELPTRQHIATTLSKEPERDTVPKEQNIHQRQDQVLAPRIYNLSQTQMTKSQYKNTMTNS